MTISNQKKYFNETYHSWQKELTDEKKAIISQMLARLNITSTNSVLDVGCGTGVLYDAFMTLGSSEYLGLDLSENMLSAFKSVFPDAKVLCGNFDEEIYLNQKFDLCIIFNSIPHFENLEIVFKNAFIHLNANGKFAIVHARTRQGLKDHHLKIGHQSRKEPIPSDTFLIELCEKNHFTLKSILDDNFFYFLCEKETDSKCL